MATLKSFRDLDVYRMALRQAKALYELSRSFPPEERYALTDQVRRSSRAVGAMLTEAWARRRYPAAFVNKVNEALGEAMETEGSRKETQAWLDHARLCGHLTDEQYRELDTAWQQIGGKLRRMEQRADDFCTTATSS